MESLRSGGKAEQREEVLEANAPAARAAEHLGKETERLNRTHDKQSIDYATAHFSQLRPELTDPSNPNGLASRIQSEEISTGRSMPTGSQRKRHIALSRPLESREWNSL